MTDQDGRARDGSAAGHGASPRRLETDEDVDRVLQRRYPPVDDPAAREAIVARFREGQHGRRRRPGPSRNVVWGALALVAGTLFVLSRKPRARTAVDRMVRRRR